MHHIGIDIIEIARIERVVARWGESFLQRIYTDPELSLYRNRPSSLAARFAAKEAVIKVFGTQCKGLRWKDIEILSDLSGKPLVNLYGEAQNIANSLGLNYLTISLSHSKEYAVALVMAVSK